MARPKTFDDDAILDDALRLFWERGFDGVSMADLEQELGVGRQSLYNVFGDKQQLFRRAFERYMERGAAMRARTLATGRGLDGIEAYFEELVEFLGGEAQGRGCLLTKSVAREASTDATVGRHCQANDEATLRAFRTALTRARELGDLPAAMPVDVVARVLLAQMHGLAVLAGNGATRAELRAAARWTLDRLTT